MHAREAKGDYLLLSLSESKLTHEVKYEAPMAVGDTKPPEGADVVKFPHVYGPVRILHRTYHTDPFKFLAHEIKNDLSTQTGTTSCTNAHTHARARTHAKTHMFAEYICELSK